MDEYLAIIKLFAGNFAPRTFAYCTGQILSISTNSALFSLLGTTYGGNGQTTFALPDLRGRVPLGAMGPGPGLSNYVLGQMSGTETVTLLTTEIPQHNHYFVASSAAGTTNTPTSTSVLGTPPNVGSGPNAAPINVYVEAGGPSVPLSPTAISPAGGSQPHANMQPYTALNYVITTEGVFPSRN